MITPLDSTIKEVMSLTWPMVVISALIFSSIRIVDIFKNKKEFVFYKEILNLVFLIYILCLFQVVTFEDSVNFGTNNFIPFKEIMRYDIGSRLFLKNVLGNLIMFVPFGVFASIYIKSNNKWQTLFLVIFASGVIETTQLLIGRVFDVDDIILNVIGGMIGYFIYFVIGKLEKRFKIFRSSLILNLCTSLMLGILIYYVWRVIS